MKIQATRRRWAYNPSAQWSAALRGPDLYTGKTYEVKAETPEFCCNEMADAWNERAVGFGSSDRMCNRDENVNIYTWSIYPEGSFSENHAINFCPFCAEPISIEVVEGEPVLPEKSKGRKMPFDEALSSTLKEDAELLKRL